ncbi:MAG: hypothetical protein V3U40_02375 [Candidatus Scalindua sediminis]
MITTGFAFLSPTPKYPNTFHLYIIISIVDTKALLVNVTTKKASSDVSCVLQVGDHDFINRESVINYGEAIIAEIDNLKEALRKREIKPKNPVTEDLLIKILKGARNSKAFRQGYLKYLPIVS